MPLAFDPIMSCEISDGELEPLFDKLCTNENKISDASEICICFGQKVM